MRAWGKCFCGLMRQKLSSLVFKLYTKVSKNSIVVAALCCQYCMLFIIKESLSDQDFGKENRTKYGQVLKDIADVKLVGLYKIVWNPVPPHHFMGGIKGAVGILLHLAQTFTQGWMGSQCKVIKIDFMCCLFLIIVRSLVPAFCTTWSLISYLYL